MEVLLVQAVVLGVERPVVLVVAEVQAERLARLALGEQAEHK